MKIKVETSFSTTLKEVKVQIKDKGKWHDFGEMNFVEREELAQQLINMAKELRK